ncbi:MAG: MBL fold metallo-hydrolase [Acidobacteria bacterium]|nr:MBL fold metallo-hydrolase [Acidobacteriota bacterium]
MKKTFALTLTLAAVLVMSPEAQNGRATLDAAAKALGAVDLKTLEFSGWGYDYVFGQAYHGTSQWPRFNVPGFTMSMDFVTPAVRDDRRRAQLESPPLGGGFQPLFGEQRQIWVASGQYAWDVVGGNPVAPRFRDDRRPTAEGRLEQLTLTPHGFIKAAMANNATSKVETIRGARKTIVSFTTPLARYEGTLNDQHLVERIEGWFGHVVLGDTTIEAAFGDYRDFSGIRFPTRIVQREGGYPLLDVTVTDVRPNATVAIEVPASIRTAKPQPPVGTSERLADGVWLIPAYAQSVAVEFRDHIVVVEAPETEAQSIAVMEVVKKTIPGKPIRYVINTHSHFDHIGGLRAYAAEGATIVTHRDNIPYLQQLWAGSWTIAPDRLAKSGRTPVFEGVLGTRMMTDGSKRLVIYHYPGNMHNPGMLMVHLPKEKILIEADSFSPPATPLTAPPNALPNLIHWFESVQRLKLDVEQVVPIHGRATTMDESRQIIERFSPNQTN